jgi:hypothetical protein
LGSFLGVKGFQGEGLKDKGERKEIGERKETGKRIRGCPR